MEFRWNDWNLDHATRHGVSTEESEWVAENARRPWPELLPDYERLYGRGAYLPRSEAEPARNEVRRLAREHGIRDRRPKPLRPQARHEQLSLLSA